VSGGGWMEGECREGGGWVFQSAAVSMLFVPGLVLGLEYFLRKA